MEITVKAIEIAKLDLKPTDHLIVKITGPEFGEPEILSSLSDALKKRFPNNQIMVFYIPEGNAMTFEVVEEVNGNVSEDKGPSYLGVLKEDKDCSIPTNYCNDCGCGKKERILAEQGND